MNALDRAIADAALGIDTLWGGDVLNPSGTGRFIADSWFSDEPLPPAYTLASAARVRETGGVGASTPDREAIDRYLAEVDVKGAVDVLHAEAVRLRGSANGAASRGEYLEGLALCFATMWDLALEMIGVGEKVPYETCVRALTGEPPEPSAPEEVRRQMRELLAASGHASTTNDELLAAVDAWRKERLVPSKSIPALGSAFIAELDALTVRNVLPHLPAALGKVPRANVAFLPIENAWFSGSMNYLGRARNVDGSPQYEATYELNASLTISVPEFQQLVSHEVVPGHVTTFAYLQDLWVRGELGFESTVLTMNTRYAALSEGIANNGVLMAYGVLDPMDLPDRDLTIGLLLALLQDDAKNQSSYLTWGEGLAKSDVAATLRRDFLVSEERADKLSGSWGRHPLLGRMYLPAYRFGTRLVSRLRREHPPEVVLPALFGARGMVDVVTLPRLLAANG